MIDLSHPLQSDTPVYPGDPQTRVIVLDSTSWPDAPDRRRLNCGQIALSLHCGTHMDAPFHFFGDGASIDRIPLESCEGPAVLIKIDPQIAEIDAEHLAPFTEAIESARRVVLNTGWHRRWGSPEYFETHPVLTGAAARFLVDRGAILVGVDTPSVDRSPFPAHLELLGDGVLIVENLTNLDAVSPGFFRFAAFPLKVTGRDGSPVRAVAWPA